MTPNGSTGSRTNQLFDLHGSRRIAAQPSGADAPLLTALRDEMADNGQSSLAVRGQNLVAAHSRIDRLVGAARLGVTDRRDLRLQADQVRNRT